MIAKVKRSESFLAWNRKQGAPYGYVREKRNLVRRFYSDEKWLRMKGPFGIQPGNNRSREFEYPWAYFATDLSSPKRVVELGGSLGGFQFVLSQEGHQVINVDPGMEAEGLGWEVNPSTISKLNHWFGTTVELRNSTLDKAGLEKESIDIIYSISVLEHLTALEYEKVFIEASRILKPGGKFVITLDLFLNLTPFTQRVENEYGTNKKVNEMLEVSGLKLASGNKNELYGFDEFSSEAILSHLETYLIGSYPVLTQCIVLEKL